MVVDVQHAVDLREMPPKTPCQIRFAYALVSHALVEDDLDCGESRKGYSAIAAGGGGRNVPAVMDTGGDGLLKGVEGTGLGLCIVIHEGGELREISGCH